MYLTDAEAVNGAIKNNLMLLELDENNAVCVLNVESRPHLMLYSVWTAQSGVGRTRRDLERRLSYLKTIRRRF